MNKFFSWLFGKSEPVEIHKHIWGPIYTYRGSKARNCIVEGCNICTLKDDNGKWLDPWPELLKTEK